MKTYRKVRIKHTLGNINLFVSNLVTKFMSLMICLQLIPLFCFASLGYIYDYNNDRYPFYEILDKDN